MLHIIMQQRVHNIYWNNNAILWCVSIYLCPAITEGVELLSLARFFQYFGNILNFLEKFPNFSLLVPWSTVMA